jgi:hypothetical protein
MKTEIKTASGRVFLIYRGKDYGSYPEKIVSFQKKGSSALFVGIEGCIMVAESISNVLVNGEPLTEDNFKELLFDNL